jgi:hypothetical protein
VCEAGSNVAGWSCSAVSQQQQLSWSREIAKDLDELLNGLDEETIQDIVRLPPLFQVPA